MLYILYCVVINLSVPKHIPISYFTVEMALINLNPNHLNLNLILLKRQHASNYNLCQPFPLLLHDIVLIDLIRSGVGMFTVRQHWLRG